MQQACPHWDKFVATSLQGRFIYKDECIRCFHTPKSPNGLDVCLTCLQGSCGELQGQEMTHKQIHYANTFCSPNDQHPISMNIKMVRKPLQEGCEPIKITKLAIGLPGGIDVEQDKYDTNVSVECHACNKELPMSDEKVLTMVNSILQAQSAFNESTIKEWELELNECHHTKNLDQSTSTTIAEKSLAHCGECDLKANLWLCMVCGHLGCGRKNYDGTGGNNHAIDHANSSHHPVVCKLGTITPEGSASIYCYDCDEEVLDKNLGAHLAKLGIKIGQQVKTEKTLTELNLEANLSLTLSKVLEEGKTLIPAFGADLTGMVNLGNTCYVNAVVQTLFAMPEFKQYFGSRAIDHLKTCRNMASNCYLCQFSKLAQGLYSGEFSKAILAEKTVEKQEDEFYQDGIRPQMFKQLVGKGHKEFQTGQQQDAREYFSHLLSFMQKGEKPIHGSDPTKAFEFEFETTLICQGCQSYKKVSQKEGSLELQVPVSSKVESGTPVQLEACLQAHFTGSLIDDIFCSKCNKKSSMLAQKRFKNYPKYLVVVLQRFVMDEWVPKKLDIELQFEPESIHDFTRFGGAVETFGQAMPTEVAEEEWVEPDLPMEVVHELMEMGIPENQAKHSVFNAGLNSGSEAAISWFYENIENLSIQGPLVVKKKAAKKGAVKEVDPESLMMIESMGFSAKQAKRALRKCDGNLERAMDWIFSHMDDPDSDNEMQVDFSQETHNSVFESKKAEEGRYKLHGFITHLGASVHAGHYVCHINKQAKWIYFNDAKVAESPDAPFGKGYMYVFGKI